MKLFRSLLLLSAITLLGSACVSRTTTRTPGLNDINKRIDPNTGQIIESKTIWFWQDDF
jgi:hypothetical protein